MNNKPRPRGLTRDAGWQIGVRRTLPLSRDAMWALVTSPDGLRCWLGELPGLVVEPNTAYRLPDGIGGTFTVVVPGSHLRLTWQPPAWPRPSIIQVRVIPQAERTVVAFHQEQLPDETAREARRASFAAALDLLHQRVLERASP